jgi:hypothetical protein
MIWGALTSPSPFHTASMISSSDSGSRLRSSIGHLSFCICRTLLAVILPQKKPLVKKIFLQMQKMGHAIVSHFPHSNSTITRSPPAHGVVV